MSAGAAHSEEEMLRDLLAPENLPAPAGAPELRSTHSSRVILADSDVFKLKRARDLGFLDYRGLSVRWHFCHEELRLNRRLAPDVYLGVVPVFRDARGYSMTRGGHVVDYAVHMRRLDESHSALTMHREGRLETDHLERLAVKLAHFESEALVVSESSAAFLESLHENFEQTRWQRGQLLSDDRWERIRTRQLEVASDTRELRASRATKDGHGDLRLEHVYFESNEPIIIDCIEFLARFRHADPALDVAFLAMDLHREGQPERAEWFLNRYAFASNDHDLYPLMALYASYRAFVRGKVAGFVVADEAAPPEVHERKAREAREYFELAERLLSPPSPRPRLIAVGGMIASGKTTLSAELAKRMPAVHLAADAVRKFLVGVPQEQPAPDHAYDAAMNTRVREELMRRARLILLSGRNVILDTTFVQQAPRMEARELAHALGLPFSFIECRAPEELLRQRLRARHGGLSDAREDLLDAFLGTWEPVEGLAAHEHLVVADEETSERRILRVLKRLQETAID